jgi:hypothetical protein
MLSMEIFDNRLIILGVMVEIFLAGVINYSWLGNFLLDTAPIPSALWGLARLNISHYLGKLGPKPTKPKRQMLLRLLAEEEARLATLDDPAKKKKARGCVHSRQWVG